MHSTKNVVRQQQREKRVWEKEKERERATNLSSKVLANTAQNRILKTVNRILKTVNWKQYLLLYYRVFIILFKLFVGSFLQFLIYFLLFCKFSLSKSFVGWQFRLAGPRGVQGGERGARGLQRSPEFGIVWGMVWSGQRLSETSSSAFERQVESTVCVCRYVPVSVCVFYLCLCQCECACAFCTCVSTFVCLCVCVCDCVWSCARQLEASVKLFQLTTRKLLTNIFTAPRGSRTFETN